MVYPQFLGWQVVKEDTFTAVVVVIAVVNVSGWIRRCINLSANE